MKGFSSATPKLLTVVLALLVTAGTLVLWQDAYAQTKRRTAKENFHRPAPTRPIKPTIPDSSRLRGDRVFLEQADSLYRPANEYEEFQIVKGSVIFRHGNMWMYCDSAWYYPEKNSLDAYGHVEMKQGDTLFVYADKLFYDGMARHAVLVKGPSRSNVELKNRTVNLVTDSLDYDLNSEMGWYTTGGRLKDDVNTLTSQYGEYSPNTKQSKFRENVLLVNNKDGYRLISEELDYNTDTHIAEISTPTRIEGANDTILTSQGWYDTSTDHAQLTARSTIIHRDSSRNVTTLEGDSIIYDKASRMSRAYMFRDPSRLRTPMVLTDTARKMTLIGEYGEYNDSTRSALSTGYPLLLEYSRPDTLFLRADTILTFVTTLPAWPDSLAAPLSAATRQRLKGYSSLQAIADAMPVLLKLLPDDIRLPGWQATIVAEAVSRVDTERADEEPENMEPMDSGAEDFPPADSIAVDSLPLSIADSMRILPRYDNLGRDSNFMVPKDFHEAKAIGRARFFNKDIQGIADTLIFREVDSILNMIRKPVVWSGERQVYGNRIDVHFNDTTADWALLPESGMVAEYIDEDFYNQMSGSRLKAYFEGEEMKRLEVDGNVETIFLPQENDSSFNKLVHAESSYLTIDMDGKQMKHLKMWPEVSGTVTPLFNIKKADQYLQGFRWLEALRPKRSWYGDWVKWDDELGEVPEEIDRYFNEAPIIRSVPKSPFGNTPQGSFPINSGMVPQGNIGKRQ